MPVTGIKRSRKSIAKFKKTMAAKRKQKKAAKKVKLPTVISSSFPLDAIPERKKYQRRTKIATDPKLELVRNTLKLLLEVLK